MKRASSNSRARRFAATGVALALSVGVAVTGAWAAPSAPPPSEFQCTDHERIDDRYIITLTPGTNVDAWVAANINPVTMSVYQRYYWAFQGVAVDLLEPEQENDLQILGDNGNVRRIDSETTTCVDGGKVDNSVVPAADAGLPWGLDRIDQRDLPLDGEYTQGKTSTDNGDGVRVYVIDSGIRDDHTQFGTRVNAKLGMTFVPGEGGDPDDPSIPGPDSLDPGDTEDCDGHGTHVAGTVGAADFGVAPAVELIPVRVFDCTGGSTASVVLAGIDWVAGQIYNGPPVPVNPGLPIIDTAPERVPTVVNMSFEGDGTGEPDFPASVLNAAVAGLIRIDQVDADADGRPETGGVPVVISAGNHNPLDAASEDDACQVTPASVAIAITVGATKIVDKRWENSNFGNCVDLFAPGVGIYSTSWLQSASGVGRPDQVEVRTGTSMAAPHVTGLAARYLQFVAACGDPLPLFTEVEAYLEATATRGVLEDVAAAPEENSPDMLAFAAPQPDPGTCP